MRVFFTDESGVEKTTAIYVWGTHSVEFEVCIEMTDNGPEFSVMLPFETDLSDDHLLQGAQALLNMDDFDGLYLTYEGATEEFAYTAEEIAEVLYPGKVWAQPELISVAAVFCLVDPPLSS